MYAVTLSDCEHNKQRAGVILIARSDFPHDKRLYVKTSDFGLWNRFSEKYKGKTSTVIMSLIRQHMGEGEPDKP